MWAKLDSELVNGERDSNGYILFSNTNDAVFTFFVMRKMHMGDFAADHDNTLRRVQPSRQCKPAEGAFAEPQDAEASEESEFFLTEREFFRAHLEHLF